MPNEIPLVAAIRIRPVLAPPQPPSLQVLDNLLPANAEQGPGKSRLAEAPSRPDAPQSANPGPARESLQNRLGVVVLLMPGRNNLAIALLRSISFKRPAYRRNRVCSDLTVHRPLRLQGGFRTK